MKKYSAKLSLAIFTFEQHNKQPILIAIILSSATKTISLPVKSGTKLVRQDSMHLNNPPHFKAGISNGIPAHSFNEKNGGIYYITKKPSPASAEIR